MKRWSLTHLADGVLLRGLTELVSQDRLTTASLLAHLAEVDARRLYLPAGYPSMHHYCVGEFRFSEDAAFRRLRAARTAREFPAIHESIANGALNLSAVLALAPHLTAANANELLAAAQRKSKLEIELLLAERFPRPDLATRVTSIVADATCHLVAPAPVEGNNALPRNERVEVGMPRARVAPLSPQRFALQVTLDQESYDDLRRVQELLAHVVPSGDVALVLKRALAELKARLEKRTCGATSTPRTRRGTPTGRTIPAAVRREVWQRDGGRCTFTSDRGHRCDARARLEFDHVIPVARGGEATVTNLRLRCRAHNYFEATKIYGEPFMRGKRERAAHEREAVAERIARENDPDASVIPWLRALGFTLAQSRLAASRVESLADAPIEVRIRAALRTLTPAHVRHEPAITSTTP